ncbi:MAG: leucyl aminopeptidase [Candidatus Woesearchaeota archaeon]|nr:MAG: leucyl aminopeptidase [Candidatus Woesearchaeota archaeon]
MISIKLIGKEEKKVDAFVAFVFENEVEQNVKDLAHLPDALLKEVSRLVKQKQLQGKEKEVMPLSTIGLLKAPFIFFVGLGKREDFYEHTLRKASAHAIKTLQAHKCVHVVSTLPNLHGELGLDELLQAAAEGYVLGEYAYDLYKKELREKRTIKTISFLTQQTLATANALKRARIGTEAVCYVRDLVNMPAEFATPAYLEKEARALAKKHKLKIRVYGKKELVKNKMNGILAVGQGSRHEPRLVVLEYTPLKKKESLALVGKGITFDAGGLGIKPAEYMEDMKGDMAGAATVLATLKAAIELGIKKNIKVYLGLAENMLGAAAYKPGDIITMSNGTTVEVLHTDAEGRVVLGDALALAAKENTAIFDFATLTGAAIVALGHDMTAVMGNDADLVEDVLVASRRVGEEAWELPMRDHHREQVKSDVADIRNIGKPRMGPGTITAGCFLEHFVDKQPWVHFDIAGTGLANAKTDLSPRGGTGAIVRTVLEYLLM